MKYILLTLLLTANISIANTCFEDYQNSYGENQDFVNYELCLIKSSDKIQSIIDRVEEEHGVTCEPSGMNLKLVYQYLISYKCIGKNSIKIKFRAMVLNQSVILKKYYISMD